MPAAAAGQGPGRAPTARHGRAFHGQPTPRRTYRRAMPSRARTGGDDDRDRRRAVAARRRRSDALHPADRGGRRASSACARPPHRSAPGPRRWRGLTASGAAVVGLLGDDDRSRPRCRRSRRGSGGSSSSTFFVMSAFVGLRLRRLDAWASTARAAAGLHRAAGIAAQVGSGHGGQLARARRPATWPRRSLDHPYILLDRHRARRCVAASRTAADHRLTARPRPSARRQAEVAQLLRQREHQALLGRPYLRRRPRTRGRRASRAPGRPGSPAPKHPEVSPTVVTPSSQRSSISVGVVDEVRRAGAALERDLDQAYGVRRVASSRPRARGRTGQPAASPRPGGSGWRSRCRRSADRSAAGTARAAGRPSAASRRPTASSATARRPAPGRGRRRRRRRPGPRRAGSAPAPRRRCPRPLRGPAWPISRMSRSCAANRRASLCTLVTSGQVASIVRSARSAASSCTAGETPCAENTTSAPSGTSSVSSTKIAPRRSSVATTCLLCTICLRTYTGAPCCSSAFSTAITARSTPAQ